MFLDIQMPEMGGFEAAQSIRDGHRETSPMWIVGFSAQPDHARAPSAAVLDDFLVKPVRLTDFARVLGQHGPASIDNNKNQ